MSDGNQQKPASGQGGLSWSQPVAAPKPVLAPAAALPLAPQGSSAGKYIGLFIAGVIVGILISWAWTAMRADDAPLAGGAATNTGATANKPADKTSGEPQVATAAFEVASPQKAGNRVEVSGIAVSVPTWVVVYETKGSGRGNALGASLFWEGKTEGIITLLRGTVAGQSYLVGQSVDNGDRKFSLTADKAVVDANGAPLWIPFDAN